MITRERAIEITNFARDLKNHWQTNDPYEIAEIYGFKIAELDSHYPGFIARIVGITFYKKVISISNRFCRKSKRVLCAHELGHAFLHSDKVCNHFAESATGIHSITEHEANLFAVALLIDDYTESRLVMPIEDMDNFMLKCILDYNIHLKK